jgi:alpha-L-arabinofuranosidase
MSRQSSKPQPRSLCPQSILRLGLLLTFSLPLLSPAALMAQATNFEIGTTVQRSSVKHLGVNLAGDNFYDSGQMFRNLIFGNPGFEGETWQTIMQCVAVTATSCTDSNIYNIWPANFLQGATFQVINGTASGVTGTITSSTAANFSGNTGLTFNFAATSTPLAVNNYLIVQMTVPGNPQAGWWPTVAGGATLSADTTDIAPDSPGKQALAINAAGSGQTASVDSYFDSTVGRSFVQLNGTYTLAFKAKGLGGNNQLTISVIRQLASTSETLFNQTVTLTGQWQDYTYSFNAAEDGTYIGTVALSFSVAGASMYLDDASLTEAAAPGNPTAYRNAVVNTLKSLQPGVLRYMTLTDYGTSFDNVIAVPFARQRAGWSPGATEQDEVPMGLEEFLVLCQTVGAEPWYTMPGGISPTDMQNLIQFLAGDASTPYGAKRAALGQSAPWTSVFPVIHLELGNEMWNGIYEGEGIADPVVYGQRAATIFAAARSSASFTASNFDLIMGSWATQPSWTQQELASSSGYDSVDGAPYLFNSLNDYGSNEAIFGPMFAQPEEVDSTATGYMAQQAQAASGGSTPANLAVYEVNLSTTSGTASQSVVNQVVAGLGAGIAVADHMLLMIRDLGITTQSMFALTEWQNSFSNPANANETIPLWGSVIDMGGQTNLKRPQYLAEQLANSAILPTMLTTTVSGTNPTWNQPQSTNDSIQLAAAHYLQTFAFTDGTHYSVVVFNLSRSGALPVTFSGTNAPTGNVLISQLTSANPTDNNESQTNSTAVVNAPKQTTVANFNPATPYSLPPYSMTVFLWPSEALPATATTLQASPTFANTGQTVTLTATVSSQSSTNIPTGTATFLNGSTSLGTATLDASGIATFNTTALPVGADSITASYGGDSGDTASTSEAVSVTIATGLPVTNTVLTSSAATLNPDQSVTFTATVSPQTGTTVATGTVTFLDGTTDLGTAQLNASGVATFSTTTLAAGMHSITASYSGDSKNAGSVSAAVSVTVTAAPSTVATTTVLTASAAQVTTGQSVTFTATVTPQSGSGVPTGTVTFLDGSTSLGTGALNASGVATFSTTTLAAGSQSITASYGGDTNNAASTSAAVTVTVGAAAAGTYTMAVSSSTLNLTGGQASTLTVTLTPAGGFNAQINLGCSGLPQGVTCTFSPTSVTPNGAPVTSTVSILAPSQTSFVPNHAPPGAPDGRLAFGWVMPWGFISLLGLGTARRRSRIFEWSFRVAFAVFLIAGSFWVSGCGGGSSSSGSGGNTTPTTTTFTLTIISTAPGTQNQSSQITVNVQS